MKSLLPTLSFALICATQLGATDCGGILRDDGFDLWCGDRLCYWKLERGDIDQVSTWHDGDHGVSMVGDDVAISQMTPVNSFDTDCIRFEMVANVAETAEVHLEADVFGDGTVDWDERIPTSSWDKVVMRVGVSGYYDGILFRLTKVGSGQAVLARIDAHVSDDEDGGCPSYIDPVSRPLGAACGLDEDCDSSVCELGVCSACRLDTDCADGEVCGREDDAPALLADWHTCVAAASRDLGELCFQDAECTTGVCNGMLCSECDDDAPCTTGECEGLPLTFVSMCTGDPRAAGEACVLDDECASGACEGRALGRCDDAGWSPCYEDDDCPTEADLTPGTCIFDAVAGGTCQ